ncbi:uncharacterized protein [Neodiprion pinetum]|uniref:uncharacterized protein n=1 Tax=Neodiprion pinetum TaxID=441929 RepID=UPI00371A70CB
MVLCDYRKVGSVSKLGNGGPPTKRRSPFTSNTSPNLVSTNHPGNRIFRRFHLCTRRSNYTECHSRRLQPNNRPSSRGGKRGNLGPRCVRRVSQFTPRSPRGRGCEVGTEEDPRLGGEAEASLPAGTGTKTLGIDRKSSSD